VAAQAATVAAMGTAVVWAPQEATGGAMMRDMVEGNKEGTYTNFAVMKSQSETLSAGL
jgi:hypothetical protein